MAWLRSWPGQRLAGAGLLLGALAAAWLMGTGEQEVARTGLPAQTAAPNGTSAQPPVAAGGGAASAPGAGVDPLAPPASGSPSADPHTQFMAAVKAARERPQPPPPPAIARAKSFPEAFEAMLAAQREAQAPAPTGGATLNPFAPVVK